jgi:hypothetical protein
VIRSRPAARSTSRQRSASASPIRRPASVKVERSARRSVARLSIRASASNSPAAVFDPSRPPAQADEQRIRADAERAGEADERVGPRDPFAALKLANRRAVKAGEEPEVFLADPNPLAAAGEVLTEDLREGRVAYSEREALQAPPRA